MPAGARASSISVVEGGMFQSVQWTQSPTGASGSSTINTSDFASAGVSEINNGGEISSPSQVYLVGMVEL